MDVMRTFHGTHGERAPAMASSDGLWALAAIGRGAGRARRAGSASADATPVSTVLAQQVGQPVTMNRMYVASVPADEGFWVDSDHGRMWVQIDTPVSRPTTWTRATWSASAARWSRTARTSRAQVGVTSAEGAADLAAAGAHITIPLNGLAFDNAA